MNYTSEFSRSRPSFWRTMLQDIAILFLLATGALAAGLGINQLRDKPLPMVYQSKQDRMDAAVERLTAQQKPAATASITLPEEIGLDQFKTLVEQKNVKVLDARPEIFHRLGHVPGAISLPREDFEAAYGKLRGEIGRDPSAPLAIYCSSSSCEDSEMVRKALVKLGHSNVGVFRGGWAAWTGAGMPEEKQ